MELVFTLQSLNARQMSYLSSVVKTFAVLAKFRQDLLTEIIVVHYTGEAAVPKEENKQISKDFKNSTDEEI